MKYVVGVVLVLLGALIGAFYMLKTATIYVTD